MDTMLRRSVYHNNAEHAQEEERNKLFAVSTTLPLNWKHFPAFLIGKPGRCFA